MPRLLFALLLLPLLGPATPARAQSKELLLFNWTNYMPPALLKRFEAETGIKVTLDTYDTNESMLAKLQAGGTGYDVVVPSGPTVKSMIRDGLLLKSDVKAMPNFKNVRAPFDKPEFDPDRAYSAPYMWGTTGIAYDTAVAKGKLDDSWKEILEPRPEFQGQIGMLSDMGEVFIAAAFYLGYDRCTEKPEEGQKILELLQRQKPYVKLYSASGVVDRMASGEVTMQQTWNGSEHRAALKRPSLAYIYPREGTNLWADNFAIAKGARNVENAKVFINFMMDPKNAAEASNFTGYNNTIAGSDQYLSDTLRNDPAVNTPPAMMSRLSLAHECPKGSLDLRERIWTRLQALSRLMADYTDTYYARTVTEPGERAPLDGVIDTETCVIGGGLAGLSTALDLAERGRSVVLLERHRVGWGASGRNGGFASAGYPNGLPALVERVGLDTAREFYAMSRGAQTLMRERIARYNIDCGPVEEGALRCGMAGATESLQKYCDDMARDFGVQMQYWPATRVREALATTRYGDAFYNPTTFRLHPLNFARGLARALEALGGRVFEQSPADALALAGARKSVRTPAGTVRCDNIVLAGGGYIGGLHWPVSMATIPIATFVLVTEPLGDLLHQTIGVPYAISDIKTATNYYRPLADGRLLWGGRVLAWEPSVAHIERVLRRDMVSFYPGLANARVEVAWGGLMPYLRHKLPVIGKLSDGLWVATGFGGLGLVLTTLAGRLIGAGLTEGDDRWRQFARFGLPFAGGKLGRVPAQFVYWRHQAENWLGRHKRA